MDNGLYHIQDNKIYEMSLNEPMKKITWDELQMVRNEIKENAMKMIKTNLDMKR